MVKVDLGTINDIVAGDNKEWDHSDQNIPSGLSVTKAWLTFKVSEDDADPGLVQKVITSSLVSGQGQITADGSALDHTASMHFDLVPADTALLVPPSITKPYIYDIQFLLSDGQILTSLIGKIAARPQVTRATS